MTYSGVVKTKIKITNTNDRKKTQKKETLISIIKFKIKCMKPIFSLSTVYIA